MFKNLMGISNLLKNAGQIGEQFNGLKDRLRQEHVTGSAGGGMAQAEFNGLGEVLRITLDAALLAEQDREMIETLVQAAVNEGLKKAREKHAEALKAMMGGLDLPLSGLDQIFDGLSAAE